MGKQLRASGLDVIGDVPWGTHFCQFYKTKADLIDLLVPYFQAGLAHNECCMWVASEPLGVEDAKRSLQRVVSNLDGYIEKGQIEILDYRQWYTSTGKFESDKVLEGWVQKEKHAIKRGFDGLRLTGNTFWLEESDWRDFREYEAAVNKVIGRHRMLAMCSYSLDRCGASEVIDVVNNHQFALIRREGKWERMESTGRKWLEESLERSETRWRLLVQSIPSFIVEMDVDGTVISLNKTQPGFSLEDFVGKSVFESTPPEGLDRLKCAFAEVIETGHPVAYEAPDYGPHRTPAWYHHQLAPVREEDKIQSLIMVVTDLTQYKRAEEALRRRAALDQVRVSVYQMRESSDIENVLVSLYEVLDDTGVEFEDCSVEIVNEEKKRIESYYLGADRLHRIRERPLTGVVYEAWRDKRPIYRRDLDEEDRYHERTRIREVSGKAIRSVVDVPFSHGTLAINSIEPDAFSEEDVELLREFAGVLSEGYTRVEDLERIEESGKALRESEERFRTIFESSLIGISIANAEGQFLQTNRAFEEMVGYTEEELRSMTFEDLTYPDDVEENMRLFRGIQEGKCHHYRMQKRYSRKDGGLVWGDLVASVVRDADGGFLYSFAMVEDITQRKQAEEELGSSQEQLRELAVRLESIREEERARTAYQIQEEFGQVMAALKMSLWGLGKSLPTDQALHKRIDFISELIDGNIRMVREMSDELRPSVLDHLGIGAAIEWHAKDFQDRTGLSCEVTEDPEDLTLDTDRSTTLFRIFQEILTNVARHAEATRVAVCLRANLDEIVLEVSDNGKGITQAQISGPSSLGLLGMRERVHPYGGKVDIRGVQRKGTTVTVRIPIDGEGEA